MKQLAIETLQKKQLDRILQSEMTLNPNFRCSPALECLQLFLPLRILNDSTSSAYDCSGIPVAIQWRPPWVIFARQWTDFCLESNSSYQQLPAVNRSLSKSGLPNKMHVHRTALPVRIVGLCRNGKFTRWPNKTEWV